MLRTLLLLSVAGCVVLPRPLAMPDNSETTVVLLTGSLGHPMDGIARHPWFAVRHRGAERWTVYEVGGGGEEEDPFTKHSPYLKPILHKVWRGEEAEQAAACIERVGPEVRSYIESHYIFYPGPNSNTFGDVVLRRCKLSASLPATSVGKDWRGIIGAGVTSERTGLQLETPIVGVKVGLKEGVEIHVIGLSFGVDLWPPAIILPLGPGRLGFADR
jgi:hypothetical protein